MTSETPGRRARLARMWRTVLTSRATRSRPGRGQRRLGASVKLVGALLLAGFAYTAFAPGVAAQEQPLSPTAAEGKELYDNNCISCHGRNAQGVDERGPSLIGVGSAAVEFQVETGRMPMSRQEAQAQPKPPYWSGEELEQNIAALSAYIQELGGGPEVPQNLGAVLDDGDSAVGGELYRINCSSCHAYSGGGGPLSSGAFAPSIMEATDRQIYAAMLSGPQNMPVFGDNQLTPEEKADIIAFIRVLQDDGDPGGVFNLGRFGPSTEGVAVFLVGIVALVFATLWIAGKS
ncbi:c-type cytochrome [Natronosporangium hydrolyticum]|uniref:Cytochrome bc1 complex cytochrome c subunit n=1 Tax=Natronosporangium hydrolyticum TaxID=2811111 RepID=A0A895YF41_9ACTN|nr:cytochrome c [Natronosporangium hydrolyticum]QSB16201.1 c-type cytochrome [Natronosporangium hydrolyticum]